MAESYTSLLSYVMPEGYSSSAQIAMYSSASVSHSLRTRLAGSQSRQNTKNTAALMVMAGSGTSQKSPRSALLSLCEVSDQAQRKQTDRVTPRVCRTAQGEKTTRDVPYLFRKSFSCTKQGTRHWAVLVRGSVEDLRIGGCVECHFTARGTVGGDGGRDPAGLQNNPRIFPEGNGGREKFYSQKSARCESPKPTHSFANSAVEPSTQVAVTYTSTKLWTLVVLSQLKLFSPPALPAHMSDDARLPPLVYCDGAGPTRVLLLPQVT